MTRAAVEAGFERFVEDAMDAALEHFNVARALRRGVDGPGASVVDRLLGDTRAVRRRVVEPRLQRYRRQVLAQFDVILEYAESGDGIDAFRDEILEHDIFAQSIRSDVPRARRQEIRDRLLERHRALGDAAAPLLGAPDDDFWAAAQATLDRTEAKRLVEEQFVLTRPVREYTDDLAISTTVDPGEVLGGLGRVLGGRLPSIEVTYTEEAIRALRRAEREVVADAIDEIDRRFDASEGP
ncbi:Uncharacterized protein HSR121_1831 [Halapricum desulfuricans]|uniref:Uncharacterized protein n=1 Tax=Halapricum desulfuricans TaxID=2841257 RepID=A0A897N5F2_9EURY|nr:Uncharacterized protein HSR121_1831 [Halapricum desulfuricans]